MTFKPFFELCLAPLFPREITQRRDQALPHRPRIWVSMVTVVRVRCLARTDGAILVDDVQPLRKRLTVRCAGDMRNSHIEEALPMVSGKVSQALSDTLAFSGHRDHGHRRRANMLPAVFTPFIAT